MRSILSLIPVAVVGVALIAFSLRPVSRARLERFARRQVLPITIANGPVVIDYLATTRRWRVCGFVAGLLVSFGVGFTQRSSSSGGAAALVGWFLGALVAEWRTDSRRAEPARRSALLVARRFSNYLPPAILVMSAVVWAGATALGVWVVARQHAPALAVIVDLCAVLVVTPVIWLIGRRIIGRPQAVSAPDVLAADDALRSRSLHVLAGCTVAINGILAALMETAAQRSNDDWVPTSGAMALDLIGGLALPILGFLVATEPFAVRRRIPVPQSGASA
jgi:hypothetical protein